MEETSKYNQHTCGNNTFEEHVAGMLDLISMGHVLGIGFGCRDSYRALIEVAEEIRHHNNFEPYEATGVATRLLNEAEQRRQVAQAQGGRPVPEV